MGNRAAGHAARNRQGHCIYAWNSIFYWDHAFESEVRFVPPVSPKRDCQGFELALGSAIFPIWPEEE